MSAPSARLQPQHLLYVVRRLHQLPPWITPRRAFHDSGLVHSLSPQLSKEGAIPRDAEGAFYHGARQSGPGVKNATRPDADFVPKKFRVPDRGSANPTPLGGMGSRHYRVNCLDGSI